MPAPKPRSDAAPTRAEHRRAVIVAGFMFLAVEEVVRSAMAASLKAATAFVGYQAAELAYASHVVAVAQDRAIRAGRAASRKASGRAFESQTGLSPLRVSNETVGEDAFRARRAAASLGKQFGEAVGDAEATTRASAYRAAAKDVDYAVTRTAATESADAWSAEWLRTARHYASLGVPLLHTWNADLDRRTCPTCEGLDGTSVRAVPRDQSSEL